MPLPKLKPNRKAKFSDVLWDDVPDKPGVYVIYNSSEVLYVGMAGRNGKGSLRKRLKDHSTGQVVNMFAQYLFLDRVQFISRKRVRHPRDAQKLCRKYISDRLSFRYIEAKNGKEARKLEDMLKTTLKPSLNP
jgi:excinuclease UvrABC nuclease subunit